MGRGLLLVPGGAEARLKGGPQQRHVVAGTNRDAAKTWERRPRSAGGGAGGFGEKRSGRDESERDRFDLGGGRRRGRKAQIDYSLALKALANSKKIAETGGTESLVTRRIRGHTFHLIGTVWIDSRFEKGMEKTVKKITAFSDAYFELIEKHAEMAKILAFSTRIVVVLDGLVVEIV